LAYFKVVCCDFLQHVDDILQFIADFTVDVEGVGHVCRCALVHMFENSEFMLSNLTPNHLLALFLCIEIIQILPSN
jgi:hypothetical protein